MPKLIAYLIVLFLSTNAFAIDLSSTVFETAGRKHHIDPTLLYAISLVESAVLVSGDSKSIVPSPWALRTDRPYYPKSLDEAHQVLKRLLRKSRSVDVGLCQINTLWHGHRVARITDLLNPQINVDIAAKILSEAIDRYPNDAFAAIGSYHSTTKARSDKYARAVLRVYVQLLKENV